MYNVSRTTVRQVLDDIQVRLPHTYTDDRLMAWINETMKKIYKDLAIQEYYSFETTKGHKLYSLPNDCSIDMIKNVVMSSKAKDQYNSDWGTYEKLRFYDLKETMSEKGYYDGTEGTIGIYPIPTDNRKVKVYYHKKPKMVTSLDDNIEIDDNYVDLVKYNVLSIIAMSGHNPDTELANEYILLYNNLVQKANESKNESQQKYTTIRDELYPRFKWRRRG